MKTRFLWIEDNARTDLVHLLTPIYMDGRYDPVIAPTVSEGLYQMRKAEFAAVVVDIRLLPGNDREWKELYIKKGEDKGQARLGLFLLYSLFSPRVDDLKIRDDRLRWVKAARFGVLTVEDLHSRELSQALRSFGITVCEQKTTRTPNSTLLKMVERLTGGTQ
jgi:hypothetical protein